MMRRHERLGCGFVVMLLLAVGTAGAADWQRFRGPDGAGISDDTALPTEWSDSKGIKWKTSLPGPGSSSAIVCGDRVFVTCYSGYGVDSSNPGSQADLKRHLICVSRKDGKIVWSKAVKAVLPEDSFRGYITEHGYASSTPVTDGKSVYVFFGKTGVLAFDFEGKQLWQVSVGTESSNRRWGSGASPILYKNTVIVNAAEESQSIRALDKATGKLVWKAEAKALELTFNTPVVIDLADGRKELVVAVPEEVWGMNPDTGKMRWYAQMAPDGNLCPSVVAQAAVVYVFGGFRTKGSLAVRAGGKGDVTKTHVLWTALNTTYVPTPVIHKSRLYWISDLGQAYCVDAKTGERIYRERLGRALSSGARVRGRAVYASMVLANEKLYAVTRRAGTFILSAEPKFREIAQNRIASDTSDFNGTPAISDGQIFLRSNRFLYCIEKPR